MAHRLAVMTEGQIVQMGTPQEVYAFPRSRFVAGFIGSTNLFTGTIVIDEPIEWPSSATNSAVRLSSATA